MTVPTATYQTFTANGIREDLSDFISNISPMDTLFLSNAKKGRAKQTFHEFQTDALAAAAANAHIQGDDSVAATASPTTRLGNYTQISKKTVSVSGTHRAVDSAGYADAYTYQLMKRSKELKRDVETSMLKLGAANAGSAATAAVSAGVACWLWTNKVEKGAAATTVTVTSGAPTTAPTAGTAGSFTEANLKSGILAAWSQGGDPNVIMMRASDKQVASGFTGIATQYKDNAEGPATVIGAADVYISDFGRHQLVASRYMPAANVYGLDMEQWKVCYLRDFEEEVLAKTGDSDKSHIVVEYTLEATAPSANFKVYTTPST